MNGRLIFASILLLSIACKALASADFKPCTDIADLPELQNTLCLTVSVPLHYTNHSASEDIELFIRQFPATERRVGALWLVAGGPGESGASFYTLIDTYRQAFPGYDIFIPDHRGTGYSSTICKEESVTSTGGISLVGQEWATCFSSMYENPNYVKAFSITHAAYDLVELIQRLSGKGKRALYGVSYGTQLSLRVLAINPNIVDIVVLDSLVPMQDDSAYDLSRRSHIVNAVGKAFIERCDNTAHCQQTRELTTRLAKLVAEKLLLSDFSADLPRSHLSDTLGMLLDIPHLRSRIPSIISALNDHDVTLLKSTLQDVEHYYAGFNNGYANYGSSIPLVQVISSSENNLQSSLSKDEVKGAEANLLFTSPIPRLLAGNTLPTYAKDRYFAALPKQIPPTLVFQGQLDPKTPIDGAQKHVNKLTGAGEIELITVEQASHFVALQAKNHFIEKTNAFLNRSEANLH